MAGSAGVRAYTRWSEPVDGGGPGGSGWPGVHGSSGSFNTDDGHPASVSDRPASLLTKTQRQRLAERFEDVDGAKRRRDERQIRERVAAGLADFEHLVDYPDDQLELALDDVDDEALRRRLAELAVVADRIRSTRDVELDDVLETATALAEESEATDPDELALAARTSAPAAGEGAATAGAASPWLLRAETALQLALVLLAVTVLVQLAVPGALYGPQRGLLPVFAVFTLSFGVLSLLAGLGVVALRGLKHDVVPVAATLAEDPVGAARTVWQRL